MKSLWNSKEASACGNDPLKLRVYTSRLLGRESSLVLHGGGNTSVKTVVKDLFGQFQEVLYIKGSGWDLATIEAEGFAAVKLDILKRMATLPQLSDTDMVLAQRAAMLNPHAPNPSVEAILHAIIPYKFVDHSHTDAVVALTNTPKGDQYIKKIYGSKVLVVPYVMPGFILARKIYEMTRWLDWKKCQGIVLLNHGLFTFGDDAKTSYENHIRLVSQAENFIHRKKIKIASVQSSSENLLELAQLRNEVSKLSGGAVIASFKTDPKSVGFANIFNIASIATRGTLTPDHVIRTKPTPLIIRNNVVHDVASYAKAYKAYFDRHTNGQLKILDLAPRWVVWPKHGLVAFGRSYKDAQIVSDIVDHTVQAIQWAKALGGWKVLSSKDIFEMEYWELEQAKLSKNPKQLNLQGKVALVTGAASGIGKACVESLIAEGAHVTALDIREDILKTFRKVNTLAMVCDVTKEEDLQKAIEATIRRFGGLDILVSNAGIFPPSETFAQMNPETWQKSLNINLTSHQQLIKLAIPYLTHGIDPTIIIIGSKNVPAPGPGAGAYSVAKAGLTQLARVAALELAGQGIRVNVLHPNQVFDTAIWTKEVLEKRAKHYGLSVEEYKKNNLLKTEITSKHVGDMVCALAGPIFAKTTGAQIPIDGGNDRVI
jgi:rhamnose utilization protein RhaD (predicted bifunctional aldolase and dehydrogenase)/NAD(P)-dependent dehydrogenase (short-subunit alcohol dehydrogenase family)